MWDHGDKVLTCPADKTMFGGTNATGKTFEVWG
jgi:hypothetical protein